MATATATATAITTDSTTAAAVAKTIRGQISPAVLMSLGASDFYTTTQNLGGLTFTARILPFTKAGHRSTAARKMAVTITLNPADYYDITVTYTRGTTTTTHTTLENVYAGDLSRLLFALDYDGDDILNPDSL